MTKQVLDGDATVQIFAEDRLKKSIAISIGEPRQDERRTGVIGDDEWKFDTEWHLPGILEFEWTLIAETGSQLCTPPVDWVLLKNKSSR